MVLMVRKLNQNRRKGKSKERDMLVRFGTTTAYSRADKFATSCWIGCASYLSS
jgi:hypothetical protein